MCWPNFIGTFKILKKFAEKKKKKKGGARAILNFGPGTRIILVHGPLQVQVLQVSGPQLTCRALRVLLPAGWTEGSGVSRGIHCFLRRPAGELGSPLPVCRCVKTAV